jgi:hypothetical protein
VRDFSGDWILPNSFSVGPFSTRMRALAPNQHCPKISFTGVFSFLFQSHPILSSEEH